MGKTREHKHDWKFKGVNPKLPQFGGQRMQGKLYVCAVPGCTATQVRGGGK